MGTTIAMIILSICFGVTAILYLWDEHKLRDYYGQVEPTRGLIHIYVKQMDEKGQDAIADVIETLKENNEVKVESARYGLKITTDKGVKVKVFDMALEVNKKLKESRPVTVMVDSRLSALQTYCIFTSFDAAPNPYFFNE